MFLLRFFFASYLYVNDSTHHCTVRCCCILRIYWFFLLLLLLQQSNKWTDHILVRIFLLSFSSRQTNVRCCCILRICWLFVLLLILLLLIFACSRCIGGCSANICCPRSLCWRECLLSSNDRFYFYGRIYIIHVRDRS